ncbi:MFS transporter [Amycolatopsis sp. YIM 10]|uniref:MFS transporter n=1 Tax=Amycolatopsis sp. YIM 10 TaxID=2653857 RepID=UPI0012905DF4|nr:MFS transporter [Amycolatopsis sp. YIM 10]QFU90563.1 Multidrug resistance protein stp [Amycolatopsis sp. YIM 10]
MTLSTPYRRRWWAVVAISLATFVTALDNTVVNVALPSIQRDFGLSIADLEWVTSSYILAFAGLMLAGGRLADIFGRRLLFYVGTTVFVLASMLAGFATTHGMLLTGRIVQGVGAALVAPTALAIIGVTFTDRKERNLAVAIWTGINGLAFAAGPVAGGLLSEYLDWSWIFFINLPIGVVTLALGAWSLAESRDPATSRYVDFPGLLTSALMMFGLTYGLIEGGRAGFDEPSVLVALGAALAGFFAFVLVERRSPAPMIDLSFFRNKVFSGGNVAEVFWGLGTLGAFFFTSLHLQGTLGFSPSETGLAFAPMALLLIAAAPFSSVLAQRIGIHYTVALGLGMITVGVVLVAIEDQTATFLSLLPGFILLGIGSGLATPLTTAILGAMPPSREGVASGILNVGRETSALLGVTVMGAVLLGRQTAALTGGASQAEAFVSGYRAALVVAAISMVLGAIVSLLTLRNASMGTDEPEPAGPLGRAEEATSN